MKTELEAIQRSGFLVAVLSDTRGLYLEAGYAKGVGKPVFGLKVEETRAYSSWMAAFFDCIAEDVESLVRFLKERGR